MSFALSLSLLSFIVGIIFGSLMIYKKAWSAGNMVGYQWGRDDGRYIEIKNIKKENL